MALHVSSAAAAGESGCEKGDGSNGALLYDKFWKTGEVAPRFSNSFKVDIERINAHGDFFRCKSCHGWDRLGREGYYIKKTPQKAKHPNVAAVNLIDSAGTLSAEQMFAKIKTPAAARPVEYDLAQYDPDRAATPGDMMPDYSRILNDAEIWDLVKFLKETAVDNRDYYTLVTEGNYPGGNARFEEIGKGGVEQEGVALYERHCAGCHGADGTAISLKGLSVGAFTREKAYELAHKVKFGQPGSSMNGTDLSIQEMKNLYKALTNETRYPGIQEEQKK